VTHDVDDLENALTDADRVSIVDGFEGMQGNGPVAGTAVGRNTVPPQVKRRLSSHFYRTLECRYLFA